MYLEAAAGGGSFSISAWYLGNIYHLKWGTISSAADRLLPLMTTHNHFCPNYLFYILFLTLLKTFFTTYPKCPTSPDLFHKDITEKLDSNIHNQFLSNYTTHQIKLCIFPSLLKCNDSTQRTKTNQDTF